ncbi:phospholipase SGR2 isoform X2 [Daucus carota subsp. sativus]|uniref:phospholipase SGR2 isoform X2 n=1 Tax=Daucus carota subsp. sativus TaxID=79200 RepID=UPI0007EFC3E3|nr:PREDICTED: phospholipase SGR2 isoform X2 [Daucus carota subsp. sativus]
MMEKKSEETSAEMLKNTPSNIRRLADEIEQCEGRQKYLAQTSSASDGGDVRWYFCKVPLPENELAASVPRAEIVGKSEYFRFGMRDSLAIESAFLQKEEELLSSWWKEYADCSEGPRAPKASSSKLDAQLRSSVLESAGSPQLFTPEEERVGVPVKGGLYEVDLVKRHCFPVYWNGEDRRVLRGQWFALNKGLDWLPLREDVAEQLEYAYRGRVWRRRTFQQSGLFAARVDLQGSTLGLHALFTGEDETWEAWLNSDASGFSSAFNFGGNGVRLRRGYASSQSSKPTQDELRQQREEEMDDYCSEVPVRHVVFMVHGIGQRLEKSNLVDDVATFRQITANLAERHLTRYQRGIQRVLFIPCQWRRNLKLSGESAVEKITLDGLRGLRVMLSATAHDILYYMSPIYCQAIIDSVSNQLNRLYSKFLKRNPGYDGKVSLYGHSLGSVLSYDILCHQDNLLSPFHVDLASKENLYRTSSNANVGKQHFESGSTSNLGKDILVKNESKGMEDATDEGMLNVNSELSSVEDLANSAPAIPPVSSADELSPVPVGSKQTNNDSTSADEHSPLPVVSKQPDDDSPSADELSPVPEGSRLPNDDSKSDEIQTNSVSGRLEGSSDDEHSLPHVESIEPHDDSPSNEVHANFVPAIHLVSASDENPPVHVGGSEPNDYSLSDNNITPPILDHCSILADVRDESNKSENRNSDLAEEKDGISENLVGCSMGNTAEVSENIEVKSIDALMKEIIALRDRIRELESHTGAKGAEKETSLTGQPASEKPPPGKNITEKTYTHYINYTKLKFKVDTFFAVGSPLGVFLALRNVRLGIGEGHDYWDEDNIREEMPACRQMLNIFHPFDPVAYRIEPLVCKEYINRRPVIIPYHRGGKRLHIGFREFAEELSTRSQEVFDQIGSIKVKVVTLCQSRNDDSNEEESEVTEEERSYGSLMLERLTGSEKGRVDHVLQELLERL